MALTPIPLHSPIGEKIDWARRCLDQYGPVLLEDPLIGDLLLRLRQVSEATRAEMADLGIVEACRICEEEEGGSCCGAGIENRYEGIMLVINGLLGVELPEVGSLPESCHFLGPEGCLLRARHVLCVNYLCNRAVGRHDPSELARLRENEGEELELIMHLYDRIGEILTVR